MSDRHSDLPARGPAPASVDAAVPRADMDRATFERSSARISAWMADYLADPGVWPVLPALRPGEFSAMLPDSAPAEGDSIDQILADFERLIPPSSTHWNHPGFFAYFSSSASSVGVLGEALSAALNANAMLWRTGPAATELEEVTLRWLLALLGLPASFDGTINDTASTSTLHALAAAREAAQPDVRAQGLSGLPPMRVYCSEEAHSSVDKAVLTLGLGVRGVQRIATDASYAMDVRALEASIRVDRDAGMQPIAVVATVGTTSTTAIDDVPAIAELCAREGLWLHVDAAYGGSAAVVPEMRHVLRGCERADSLVVNPHKWMFVPIDCSVLYTQRPDVLRRAFSLVPEYLVTADSGRNLMDYGVALGRRFRSLKLWFVLRYFGANGLAARIREHVRLARLFASWVEAHPSFELLTPVNFATVVFRYRPAAAASEEELDALNAQLLDGINASGDVFLSHTRAKGRYVLRIAIGNVRTAEGHVAAAWAHAVRVSASLSA